MSRCKPALLPLILLAGLGCGRPVDEAQLRAKILAEEAAKAADARVARLEQELADLKTGKADPKEHEKGKAREALEQAKADQQKALERQISEQKRKAEARKQEVVKLAEAKPASPASPATTVTAPPPPAPVVLEVPAGTAVAVTLAAALSTETAKAGDLWQGTLAEPIAVGGRTAWPAGTPVGGVVSQSVPAGRLASGQGALGLKLTEIGSSDVEGGTYVVAGDARGERNAKIIGGAAALGALAGLLSNSRNKGDHALGGAAIGAAAGTAAAAATARTAIVIPADKPIAFSLQAAEKLTLRK